jgi:GT2 family glycosyltransferase
MSEPDAPTIAVAVCTKGRHRECLSCLESIYAQTRPPSQLIVVEAADDDRLHDAIRERWPDGRRTTLTYLRVPEGRLTRQRNIAAGHLTSDVILFVDDDSTLERDCLERLAVPYREDSDRRLGGVQAAIIEHAPRPAGSGLFRRMFLLTQDVPTRPAVLLASGWPRYCSVPERRMPAEVIRGTAASYRREVFEAERFDEGFPGYGLAEDCDFSYRVSRHWRLLVEPAARTYHSPSPVSRPASRTYHRMLVVHSWHLFWHYRGRPAAWPAFLWSRIGNLLLAVRHGLQIGSLGPMLGAVDGYRIVLRGRR